MSKIELEIHRIETGERLVAGFEDAAAAATWLRERPRFVEVRRVLSTIDPTLEATLRAAMRPLDAEEVAQMQAREVEQIQRMQQARAELEAAAMAEHVSDDPDRPMVVRWAKQRGMWIPDETDGREIPPHVQLAVQAWIDERNSWIRDRGQHVATAIVTVHPGPVPSGREEDRIEPGGQFVKGDGPPDDAPA